LISHRHSLYFASGLFLSAALASVSPAQQPSTQQPPAPQSVSLRQHSGDVPAPKTALKKVWTDDSISDVRSPADKYLDDKAAAAKAAANKPPGPPAKPSQQKLEGAPPLVLQIPKTPEETQQAIDQRKDLRDDFHRLLSDAQERLQTEPDPLVRKTLQQKIGLLNLDIDTTSSEIQTLQNALVDYQHGKIPVQPKPEDPSNPQVSPKPPAAQDATAGPH
jgi:hypothetical protein